MKKKNSERTREGAETKASSRSEVLKSEAAIVRNYKQEESQGKYVSSLSKT
jgi:hypothetical protein